ncbi:MAG TPA: O-methyltransferase [Microvirga sp.]|jgi:hypothetical protein|nr:O-methyltransferase [Microvirga sp.]
MSGAAIPYHLRPHKSLDRRLFLDLLSRYERWQPLDNYAYISMGAYPLEDHKLVHRLLGLTKLVAFDLNPEIVARQKFNRPIETCQCIERHSRDVARNLETVLSECGFPEDTGAIVWLDYTEPSKIGDQLREFEDLIDQLKPGDIARVTVNAQPYGLLHPKQEEEPASSKEKKQKKQFENLKERIGDYLPSWVTWESMTLEQLPLALSAAFATAARNALPVGGTTQFAPLSIVRYADGQQMLVVTGTVAKNEDLAGMAERMDLAHWPFTSSDWSKIHQLVVPDLTLRERLFLERGVLTMNSAQIIDELGFKDASGVNIQEFLEVFRTYYRFYPTLLPSPV